MNVSMRLFVIINMLTRIADLMLQYLRVKNLVSVLGFYGWKTMPLIIK